LRPNNFFKCKKNDRLKKIKYQVVGSIDNLKFYKKKKKESYLNLFGLSNNLILN
jgi:hypothetical protein